MPLIRQAFVLGAGLGTRLRSLTESLPKPLVPIFQKPLITFAFDHLIDAGCERLIVNTHHQPECFAALFPAGEYRGRPLTLRHEPVLLETGGGIANVADLLGEEPFLVYNADILTDLPLAPLIESHTRAENLVTLALRSGGGPQQVAFDPRSGRILDIRGQLGTGAPDEFVFTGVYVVDPKFTRLLTAGVKRSVIPTFLEIIASGGKLGGVVLDEGNWWDVGTRDAYLQLHRDLPALSFPSFPAEQDWRQTVHPTADLDKEATLSGCSVLGRDTRVGEGAQLHDTIVWPGAQIASRSYLRNCIVRSHQIARGTHNDVDI